MQRSAGEVSGSCQFVNLEALISSFSGLCGCFGNQACRIETHIIIMLALRP